MSQFLLLYSRRIRGSGNCSLGPVVAELCCRVALGMLPESPYRDRYNRVQLISGCLAVVGLKENSLILACHPHIKYLEVTTFVI